MVSIPKARPQGPSPLATGWKLPREVLQSSASAEAPLAFACWWTSLWRVVRGGQYLAPPSLNLTEGCRSCEGQLTFHLLRLTVDEAGDLPLMEELTLWEVAAGLGGAAVVRDWRPLLPALRTPVSSSDPREGKGRECPPCQEPGAFPLALRVSPHPENNAPSAAPIPQPSHQQGPSRSLPVPRPEGVEREQWGRGHGPLPAGWNGLGT